MTLPAYIRLGKIYEISTLVPKFGGRRYVIGFDPKESVEEEIGYVILYELWIGEKEHDFQVQYGNRVVDFTDNPPLFLKPKILDKNEFEPVDEMPEEKKEELKRARREAEKEENYYDPYFRSR